LFQVYDQNTAVFSLEGIKNAASKEYFGHYLPHSHKIYKVSNNSESREQDDDETPPDYGEMTVEGEIDISFCSYEAVKLISSSSAL